MHYLRLLIADEAGTFATRSPVDNVRVELVTTFLIVIGVIVGLWVLVQVLGILWITSKVLADPRHQAEQWATWKASFVRTWQTPSTWFSLMVGALYLLLLWGTLLFMDLNRRPDHQDVVGPVRDRMVRPLGGGQ